MWSSALINSLDVNELLSVELDGIETDTTFPDTHLGRRLETVARLMETREARGADIDTFYLEIGGFDTHADVEENLSLRFIEVNAAIDAFVSELKSKDLFDAVTTIQTSDFARTLSPNSGDGTDHAWGGNYMMFGGAVAGGKILGKYPDDLTAESPLNVGRGRMIPTTPWDAVFSTIATWLGVPDSDLDKVCPNIGNFDSSFLIDPNDAFNAIPAPVPTMSPTTSSPTKSPAPSFSPSESSSSAPSATPSATPNAAPSRAPSHKPSREPTMSPSTSGTMAPSPKPTFTSTCFDDDSYRVNGAQHKSCSWVARDFEAICYRKDTKTKMRVWEHCRKTCKRCKCTNDDFYFRKPSNNCAWVKRRAGKRCDLHPSIREHCKSSCGETCCADDENFRLDDIPTQSCAWAKKNKKRCTNLVSYYCPVACARRIVSGGCNYDPFASLP